MNESEIEADGARYANGRFCQRLEPGAIIAHGFLGRYGIGTACLPSLRLRLPKLHGFRVLFSARKQLQVALEGAQNRFVQAKCHRCETQHGVLAWTWSVRFDIGADVRLGHERIPTELRELASGTLSRFSC